MPRPTRRAEGIHMGTHRYGWEHVGVGGHALVGLRASVWHLRAVGATGEGPGACIGGATIDVLHECIPGGGRMWQKRCGVAWGRMEVAQGWQVGCGGPEVRRWDAVDHLELVA